MLYSYKCILCEFETYFQRKPIRPFPKSCSMSLEQTYGKIHIFILYVYVSNQIQQNNMHFGHQVLILFWTHLPCFFSILSVCMPGLFCSRAQFRRAAFWLVRIAYCGKLGPGKNCAMKRFRNCAISNHDFISIYRTALYISNYSSASYQASKAQSSFATKEAPKHKCITQLLHSKLGRPV